ncbi:MAG: DNA-directed DNA polymerase II small subunit [Thermoplasmata archaeon]|nr:DNA-directed DNA polymerase II small subunit [Thermoplasmata archaeon]
MQEDLLSLAMESGVLLDPELADYLAGHERPVDSLLAILASINPRPLVLTLEEVQAVNPVPPVPAEVSAPPVPRMGSRVRRDPAGTRREDHDADVVVLQDITGRSTCTGEMKDFARYFDHRYKALSGLLRSRRELVGAVSIDRALKMTREVRLIGIVQSVKRTRTGNYLLLIEDEEGACQVLVPSEGSAIDGAPVPDEVIGVVGRPWKDDILLADEILRPNVPPTHAFSGADEPLCAAFVSDIHVGSRLFLRDRWERFARWLGTEEASRIKYLVVVGDVVDGIGVYPRQDEDLSVDDVYRQYEQVATMMGALPDDLQVIILPGNHDATRPAEPQPALSGGIQEAFPDGVLFVGNPSLLRLHGVDVLCYHGKSMDDLVTSIPSVTYDRPLSGMVEMLKRRHLAPSYGGKTPLAPERADHLIVDVLPSIFVTGHVHGFGIGEYRGIRLLNASTWQGQTAFQRMHNITPKPGMVPIVDLQTGEAFAQAF